MTGGTIEKERAIARQLLAEHASRTPYHTLTGDLALANMAEAYRAQQAFIAQRRADKGVGIAGYKIALTSKAMQDFVGVGHPLLGAIFEDTVSASPADISLADFQRVGIEFELALRLGRDVPAAPAPYDAESIAAFVDAVIPAFELVEDRNAVYENFDALSLVADNAWSAGVVLGTPVGDWRALDLAATPARLEANGEVETATTGAALGNPLNALAWAANELGAQGRPLSAGMIVMTGSTMKTRFPAAGDAFHYGIEGVGEVRLSILP
ncbi:2-keto-4-pentenoate hydratase [Nisaea sediminum]|uniref:2-keto-4-pentenoate hydratase n=1 Tax=Nisaea sediminum TaxID=2775867 RepID=UPI001865A620|nr:fumarylacetoacetate hydrolase family protein [Nisaea sediminum]